MRECHQKWAGYQETEPVAVDVLLTRPAVLILMGLSPIVWNVKVNNPSLINKLVLTGSSMQHAQGLPRSVPIDVGTTKASPMCSHCTAVVPYPFTTGPDDGNFSKTIAAIEERVGLQVTTFQAARKAAEFVISDRTARLSDQNFVDKFLVTERDIIDQEFHDVLKVSNQAIPLPEGTWKGLVLQEIGKERGEDQAFVLYKTDGRTLTGLLAIRVTQSLDGSGFRMKSACEGEVGYRNESMVNEAGGEQLCYWVEHLSTPWEKPLFQLTAKRLEKRGIWLPSVLINAAYHLANSNRSMTTYYLTNPETEGISTQSGSWLTSPWHPRKLANDDERRSFVDDKVEWMDTWFQILRVQNAAG